MQNILKGQSNLKQLDYYEIHQIQGESHGLVVKADGL
jgi:hypothetical protein